MSEPYASFREFYPHYLAEHRNRTCRRLHFVGSALVLVVLALVIGRWLSA
ncbi:MAG: Mpo1-like protein, partial [Lysobacterales bacterium]